MNIQRELKNRILLISEENTTGRGRGIAGIGAGGSFMSNLKNAFDFARIDVLNLAPPEADDFSLMNYYTLDVRLKDKEAIPQVQRNRNTYYQTVLEAIDTIITKGENEKRIKNYIKRAMEEEEQEMAAKARKKQRGRVQSLKLKNESSDTFDLLYNGLLEEASLKLNNDERNELASSIVNQIDKNETIRYKNKKGEIIDVYVTGLPGEVAETVDGKRFRVPNNSIQIRNPITNTLAVPNIITIDGTTPFIDFDVGEIGNFESENTHWKNEWDEMPFEEFKNIDVISDVLRVAPPFLITTTDNNVESGGGFGPCIIDSKEFVNSVVDALVSSFSGHHKQGVTLEDLLTGKFSAKVLNPEEGAFINRVKDPTSRQPLNFRAWNHEDLKIFHEIIMSTFKRSNQLNKEQQSLILYMTQEHFDKFVKGGRGVSKIVDALASELSQPGGMLNA